MDLISASGWGSPPRPPSRVHPQLAPYVVPAEDGVKMYELLRDVLDLLDDLKVARGASATEQYIAIAIAFIDLRKAICKGICKTKACALHLHARCSCWWFRVTIGHRPHGTQGKHTVRW